MSGFVKRLLVSAFVVWAVASLTFVISHVLPEDPARLAAGAQARPADVERLRAQLGLDRSLPVQYGAFFARLVHRGSADAAAHATCASWGFVHVDLGRSYQKRLPVVVILGERLPRTLALAAVAVALQALLGTALGTFAATRRGRWSDSLVVGTTLVGISAPTFVIGLILQYVLAHRLRLVPLDGFGKTFAEHAACIVLPATTLALYGAASYARIVRDEMIGLLGQDFVRTARAKGLGEIAVIRHALRNAAGTIVTIVALDLGALVSGAVVTETLFRWPGMGALSVTALLDRDGPVLLGIVLVSSTAIVLAGAVADLAVRLLDPRIRRR
ncbi:MAG: ABC transporter permease [Myxococcales bacterium]|nr:ABC transporter permease [Myxococcales bacterium]